MMYRVYRLSYRHTIEDPGTVAFRVESVELCSSCP